MTLKNSSLILEISWFMHGVLSGMLVEIAIALPLRVRIRQSSWAFILVSSMTCAGVATRSPKTEAFCLSADMSAVALAKEEAL